MLVCLAVVLVGCRLDIGLQLDVQDDASGTISLSIITDSELNRAADSAGVDPLGTMVQRIEQASTPWDVQDHIDETTGSRTVTVTADFDDPDAFAARYGELADALDAPEARLLGPLSLSVDPETEIISLEGSLPLEVREPAAADLGIDLAALEAQLQDVVSSSLAVQTPGAVLSVSGASGAEAEETGSVPVRGPYPDGPLELTWVADGPGVQTPVAAQFEPGGADITRLVVLGGLGAVLIGALGATVLLRRRSAG